MHFMGTIYIVKGPILIYLKGTEFNWLNEYDQTTNIQYWCILEILATLSE